MLSRAGLNALPPIQTAATQRDQHRRRERDPPGSPALQRDRRPRRRQRPELAEQVTRVPPHGRAQLGRAGHPAGRGEGLGQLIGREVGQRASVHPLRAGPDGQHQHHVAQIDRLPPGRRADLGEGYVDQQQLAVADHEVPGLDVAVRDARIPQLPDQQQSLVDDAVVHLGLADLDRPGEELGDEQVLALRRDLHDPVRRRGADPRVPEQAQQVVLVLGQLLHRGERVLVLQRAVLDRAP